MNLTARTVHIAPDWCTIGARIRADAPTLLKPIIGAVAEIDGYIITVRTDSGMVIAVDIEDCRPVGTNA